MPKLITKFTYLKPTRKKNPGNYAIYIATRDGVEKLPQQKEPTLAAKTYADYIATRPRAERIGSHGLFTNDGEQVVLSKVSAELNQYNGNIWTAILSLGREDAEMLGFNNATRWRDMLRTQTQAIAENFKIPLENLTWYGAFHNESHHPHVHLIIYSTNANEGYLTKKGVENLRYSFAKDIFAQDFAHTYARQTSKRDELRKYSIDQIAHIVQDIQSGVNINPQLETLLVELSAKLANTSGKKVYGYLPPNTKNLVDSIVNKLAADNRIVTLYDLWYEQKENILKTYTDDLPPRLGLVDNREFKSIKNAIIQAAMQINMLDMVDQPQEDLLESTQAPSEPQQRSTIQRTITAYRQPLSPTLAAVQLLAELGGILQSQLNPYLENEVPDSKEKSTIRSKKQRQGLRQ